MNFVNMWSLRRSDLLCVDLSAPLCMLILTQSLLNYSFWELALPILALVVPIALWADLKKMWYYIQKRRNIRNV